MLTRSCKEQVVQYQESRPTCYPITMHQNPAPHPIHHSPIATRTSAAAYFKRVAVVITGHTAGPVVTGGGCGAPGLSLTAPNHNSLMSGSTVLHLRSLMLFTAVCTVGISLPLSTIDWRLVSTPPNFALRSCEAAFALPSLDNKRAVKAARRVGSSLAVPGGPPFWLPRTALAPVAKSTGAPARPAAALSRKVLTFAMSVCQPSMLEMTAATLVDCRFVTVGRPRVEEVRVRMTDADAMKDFMVAGGIVFYRC